MRIVHSESFYHDGRGPSLIKVHLAPNSAHLLAIDFALPDAKSGEHQHLRFIKAQAYQFTPEEVENYSNSLVDWGSTNKGALVSVGKSAWLKGFSQQHLANCEHYRVMFYDEILDVICEQIVVDLGSFTSKDFR
jgi:hypothetical protein